MPVRERLIQHEGLGLCNMYVKAFPFRVVNYGKYGKYGTEFEFMSEDVWEKQG